MKQRRQKTNNHFKPSSKTLFIFLIFCMAIFSINLGSAMEIDNRGDYDTKTRTMTIKNSFGFGSEVASLKLNTPIVNRVGLGYQKVAEFTVNNADDYTNALKEMRFYNRNDDMKPIQRIFDYKIISVINVLVDDYSLNCRSYPNGTIQACSRVISGSHYEQREVFSDITSRDLLKGEVTIGIFTEVQKDDNIEWIPTFYGVEIVEWATWTADLNVDLESYWKLNETSGLLIDSLGQINMTATGSVVYGDTGIIGTAVSYDSNAGYFNSTGMDLSTIDFGTTGDFSYNFWIKTTDATSGEWVFITNDDNTGGQSPDAPYYGATLVSGALALAINDGTNKQIITSSIDDGVYHMITFIRNVSGTECYGFVDGVMDVLDLSCGAIDASARIMAFGDLRGDRFLDAIFDEFGIWDRQLTPAEVTQLYNGGSGITHQVPAAPVVTLNSPIQSLNTTANTIDFNCTAKKVGNKFLQNVTLLLDGELNETRVLGSEIDLTTEIFTKTVSFDDHNWSCISSGTDNLTNTPVTRIFNVSKILEINQTFNNITSEGATETFEINFESSQSVTAVTLFYNGTPNAGTINAGNFPNISATATVIVPLTTFDVNVTFVWQITLADSTMFNSSSNNQTIMILGIDTCSTFTNQIFNYTLLDEATQVFLDPIPENTSIELDILIFSEDRTALIVNFSNDYDEINSALVCLNLNISNGTIYRMDSTAKYSSLLRETEYHNIRNQTLDNESTSSNIKLFDLLTEDSTEFQITFKDSDFVVVENALIQVNRQYVSEGVFKTVEIPLTDSNGQTVVHLVKNDVIYNFVIVKDGVIIGVFNNQIGFCEDDTTGSCFIALNALEANEPVFNYDEALGLGFSFDYNETSRVLLFNFVVTDGSSKTIGMNAIKMDQIGNTTACDESITSSSGTLSCTLDLSIGNETIIVTISINGVDTFQQFIKAGQNVDFGDAGYFLMFFMVLSLAMMFTGSKTMVIVGVILGFIMGVLLEVVKGGLLGASSFVIWLIIGGMILIWKMNSDK